MARTGGEGTEPGLAKDLHRRPDAPVEVAVLRPRQVRERQDPAASQGLAPSSCLARASGSHRVGPLESFVALAHWRFAALRMAARPFSGERECLESGVLLPLYLSGGSRHSLARPSGRREGGSIPPVSSDIPSARGWGPTRRVGASELRFPARRSATLSSEGSADPDKGDGSGYGKRQRKQCPVHPGTLPQSSPAVEAEIKARNGSPPAAASTRRSAPPARMPRCRRSRRCCPDPEGPRIDRSSRS